MVRTAPGAQQVRPGSAVAEQLGQMNPRLRKALRADDVLLDLLDALVSVSLAISDQDSGQPLLDRVTSCFEGIDSETLNEWLKIVASGEATTAMEGWAKRLRGQNFQAFARRLLGAARYDQLRDALVQDFSTVGLAVRRLIRISLPLVVAWDSALAVLTPEQAKTKNVADLISLEGMSLVYSLDKFLGDKVLNDQTIDHVQNRDAPISVDEVATTVRGLISERSAAKISQINAPLNRKLRGARDALMNSADGVSQAAHSMIELIDRLMRERASEDQVLAWLEANDLVGDLDLTYMDNNGRRRTTKRSEALCFVYGLGDVKREATETDDGIGPSVVHNILAMVIVTARSKLQSIKHADAGTEGEKSDLLAIMASIEGGLFLGITMAVLAEKSHAEEVVA